MWRHEAGRDVRLRTLINSNCLSPSRDICVAVSSFLTSSTKPHNLSYSSLSLTLSSFIFFPHPVRFLLRSFRLLKIVLACELEKRVKDRRDVPAYVTSNHIITFDILQTCSFPSVWTGQNIIAVMKLQEVRHLFPQYCFLAHLFFPPGLINSCLNPEREALHVDLTIHSHHRAQWLVCPVIIYIRKRFWGAAVTQQPQSHLQKLLCFVGEKTAFVYTSSIVYRDMKTKVAKVNRSSFSP